MKPSDFNIPERTWRGRALLLVDLDAFFATSVEQLDHPAWRGKPVIVGGRSGQARRRLHRHRTRPGAYGVPLRHALGNGRAPVPRRHLDDVRISTATASFPPRSWAYSKTNRPCSSRCLSTRHTSTCHRDATPARTRSRSPRASRRAWPSSASPALSGSPRARPWPKSPRIWTSRADSPSSTPAARRRFSRRWSVARHARHRQAERRAAPNARESARSARSQMPRSTGSCPSSGLTRRRVRDRAQGIDPRGIVIESEVKSVSHERTFATDLVTREEIEDAIDMLGPMVGRRLRKKGLAGHTVTLKLRYADLSRRTAQKGLSANVDDETLFIPVAKRLIRRDMAPGRLGAASSAWASRASRHATSSSACLPTKSCPPATPSC